jgi:hypothetical protein
VDLLSQHADKFEFRFGYFALRRRHDIQELPSSRPLRHNFRLKTAGMRAPAMEHVEETIRERGKARVEIIVFLNVTSCSFVDVYQGFEGTRFHQRQSRRPIIFTSNLKIIDMHSWGIVTVLTYFAHA